MNSPFPSGAGFSLEEPLETPGGETAGGHPQPGPPAVPLDLVATKGCADVMARRLEQWVRYGHTPEADARLSIYHFAAQLQSMTGAVIEDSRRSGRLAIMRKHTVTLAAFALALVDRIDAEPPEEELPPL